MNVFLSWSGQRSGAVARVLEKYLPSLINQVRPWLSSKEIATGARWSVEIASSLESANIGVICLTAENLSEPWILFEAGAIAKLTAVGRAMVLRIGLNPSDVTGPLSQFQSVTTDRDGLLKLVSDINAVENFVKESTLDITFDALWPRIEQELQEITKTGAPTSAPQRSSEEMLQELLGLVRRQDFSAQQIATPSVAVPLRPRSPSTRAITRSQFDQAIARNRSDTLLRSEREKMLDYEREKIMQLDLEARRRAEMEAVLYAEQDESRRAAIEAAEREYANKAEELD